VYEYDEDGRLARATTSRDPEWLETDRAEALALLLHERGRCPGCGLHLDESAADEADGAYTVDEAWCHACIATRHVTKEQAGQPGYLAWPVRKPPG
jgi:hypothetical protein